MLELLRVRAFAIIDELEAHFAPGFNVLTGETGAGKSILVDALHLVLGGRAQADAVRTGAEEAEVQALFRPRDPAATDARLVQLGLPSAGAELVVRRTVQREGRSRAWVNGALATAAQLAQATRGLLDISGQHEHVGLLDAQTHLAMLDRYAGLSRGEYEAAFAALAEAERERARLDSDESARAERASFLRYQLDELEKADAKAGEDEALAQERRVLAAAEKLRCGAEDAEAPVRAAGGVLARGCRRAVGAGHGADGNLREIRSTRRGWHSGGRRAAGSRRARVGGAAPLPEPRRGAAAAGAHRLRGRVISRAPRREACPRRRRRRGHLPVRRGRRWHRRRDRRRGRARPGGGGARPAGDLHHTPAPDRRVRGAPPGGRKGSAPGAHAQPRGGRGGGGAGAGAGPPPVGPGHAGGAPARARAARESPGAARLARAESGVRCRLGDCSGRRARPERVPQRGPDRHRDEARAQ